jgi:hypothetical protein
MKINEVITEITNPYLRGIVKGITGMEWEPSKQAQPNTAIATFTSTPSATQTTRPSATSTAPTTTVAPSTAVRGLPAGVSVVATNPLVLQVGKQKYELDDKDQWHPLGSKKTVSPGQAAILNKYLDML